MFGKVLSVFVAGLAVVSAFPTPVGNPNGNNITKPGLNEPVPVGTPYQITWIPTTQGPVSIQLLRGPSSNAVPFSVIAESIPNTGIYSWTPSTDLEDDTSRYGIQLVVDATGQYQYSTQFGISNPAKRGVSSSSSSASSSRASSSSAASVSSSLSSARLSSSSAVAGNSTATSAVVTTSRPINNGTVITPTASLTITPSTTRNIVTATGAAGQMVASFGGAVVAAFAAVAAL